MTDTAATDPEALKGEVVALRRALEEAHAASVAAEQRAGAERQAELDELRATIVALRDEMIRQRDELGAALRTAQRDAAAEAEQLRRAVVAARHHADELHRQHALAAAEQAQRFDTERRELHDTITELRRRLESATPDHQR
ncbi:MAG: hypothetical protein MUE78_09815 [Ilumatobacteraceae bacterium]|jgi:hypothetical protein|nr:hypothetical protein [Ilumatobacteraceae bacterium]